MKRRKRQYQLRYHWRLEHSLHQRVERRKAIKKKLYRQRIINRRKIKAGKSRYIQNVRPQICKIHAPRDFRLNYNTKRCANFFQNVLSMKRFAYTTSRRNVFIDLSDVDYIDFPSALMLNAIGEELSVCNCAVLGVSSKNQEVHRYLKESGFFNKKYDRNGKLIVAPGNSRIMKFHSGSGVMKEADVLSFVELFDKAYEYLGEKNKKNIDLYVAILKEICGNSIEWGDIKRRNWTICIKFEGDKVLFVALDLGQGILKSLDRRIGIRFLDAFKGKNDCEILEGVFNSYYGSKSKDPNRNQGLPFIKKCNTNKQIKRLRVITNNVVLNFDNTQLSCRFSAANHGIIGTLYYWEIDNECLKN